MGVIGKRYRGEKLTKEDFTEYEIQRILCRDYMTHPKYVLFNLYIFDWESDFLFCTQAGYWHEVEIKISLSDFKNEFKHKNEKYFILENGYKERKSWRTVWNEEKHCNERQDLIHNVSKFRPNYFSYCVPYYLVEKVESLIPCWAGLYYINEYGKLINKIAPVKLHSDKIEDKKLNLTTKFYYAYNNWRSRYMRWHQTETDLRAQISWLKAEYKAAMGFDITKEI